MPMPLHASTEAALRVPCVSVSADPPNGGIRDAAAAAPNTAGVMR